MDFVIIALTLLPALTLLYAAGICFLAKNGGGKRRLPPGPIRLPLIGNLHQLGNKPHESLAKLAKIHGPIMSLKLGQVTTIVVSSSKMAKEVLKNQDLAFSSRSIPNALYARDDYKYSIIVLPVASRWRSLRKVLNTNIFSVKMLDRNQHLRCKKVEELIAYCRKNSETGKAVDIGRAAFRTTLNLLSNTIFSKDLTDPFSDSAKEFRELIQNTLAEAGKPNLVDFYPILAKIDPQGIRRRMDIHLGKLLHLFGGLIDERLKSGAVGDVLDALLIAGQETPELDRKQIEHLFMDLFVAGIDTTSSTIEWAMTEILNNPDKLKKIQDELTQVAGKGNVIKDADVARLPYLRCVVKETLRVHPPVPFLVPRQVEQDVDVCGYNVPKGSGVLVNVWAIGKDETIWKDALTFEPERFLESEVDMLGQDFELTPFGAGRRICPGLPLASRMMLVMLGSLLNSFDWKPEGKNALDMEEKFGFTLQKASPLLVIPFPL